MTIDTSIIEAKPIHDQAAKDKLYADLPAKVAEAIQGGRPLMHKLNGDTTWLYQLPLSSARSSDGIGRDGDRRWFNILLDPWFVGQGTTLHRWFIGITHNVLPVFSTVDEVVDLCVKVEELSRGTGVGGRDAGDEKEGAARGNIDLILCGNPKLDHVHPETLRTVDPLVPIAGGREAVQAIRRLKHFENVYDLGLWTGEDAEQQGKTTVSLPDGMAIYELAAPDAKGGIGKAKTAPLEVAFYLKWLHPLGETGSMSGQGSRYHGLIHAPHGLIPSYAVPSSTASLDILALIACTQHGHLSAYFTLMQTNHGTDAGFAAIARSGARRYIATHDEDVEIVGLISYLQKLRAGKEFEVARADALGQIEVELIQLRAILEPDREREEDENEGGERKDGPGAAVQKWDERVKELEEQMARVKGAVCSRPEVGETTIP